MNTENTTLSPVPFHGQTLFVATIKEQPYAPMKPIVEGMGLDWAGQYTKFNSYRDRWGIEMISIPSDGGNQEMVCMPVRKLPAWLSSINPKKVRPEIRETVVTYQNECDDALWNYWTKGEAKRGSFSDTPIQNPFLDSVTPWRDEKYSLVDRISMFMSYVKGYHSQISIMNALGLSDEHRDDFLVAVRFLFDQKLVKDFGYELYWASKPFKFEAAPKRKRMAASTSRHNTSPVTDSDLAVRFGQMSAAKATFMDASADVFRSIKRKFEFAPNDYAYPERSEAVQTTYATEAAFYALDRVLDCIESLTKAAAYRQ